ncbi:MAG TPA: 50S ribosomal protein L29 [Candidatus Eisenbacteria bacterium]|nr:50S ribosomal protein L29 [Candidatus Eisenbacteria bacterium]
MAKVKKPTTEKSTDEMQVAIADLRAEINKLAMENAKRQLKNTTSMRTKKDELARLLTKMNMVKFLEKSSVKEEQK